MAERNYTPTMGMVRELARASLGEPSAEPFQHARCRRRGLLSRTGLTPDGHAVLARVTQQFEVDHG